MSIVGAIDNVEFARLGRTLDGRVSLVDMSRAADLLESADLEFHLRGYVGQRGEPMLHLDLSGVIGLRCQRCLEKLSVTLEEQFEYELRAGEDRIGDEDLLDDARDFLVFDRAMSVLELVEDEVILGVPVAPKHEACGAPGSGVDEQTGRPFAVLAGWKK